MISYILDPSILAIWLSPIIAQVLLSALDSTRGRRISKIEHVLYRPNELCPKCGTDTIWVLRTKVSTFPIVRVNEHFICALCGKTGKQASEEAASEQEELKAYRKEQNSIPKNHTNHFLCPCAYCAVNRFKSRRGE